MNKEFFKLKLNTLLIINWRTIILNHDPAAIGLHE